jgi:hypothetical protein
VRELTQWAVGVSSVAMYEGVGICSRKRYLRWGCLDHLRDWIPLFFDRGGFSSRALLRSYLYGIFQPYCHKYYSSFCMLLHSLLESRAVSGAGGLTPISGYSLDIHSQKR